MRRRPTCHPLPSGSADRQDRPSPASCRRVSSNILSSTDFTDRFRRTRRTISGRWIRRQAGCMAKVEKRRKAAPFPKQVAAAIEAAADKKANDLVVLDLRKATGFTDFFVICSGTNPRQISAIADSVTEALARNRAQHAHVA